MLVLRKILGVFMLVIGLVTFGIFMAAVFYSGTVVDQIGVTVDQSLAIVSDSLNAATDTIEVARQTVVDATTAVGTVSETVATTSKTFADTGPLLDGVTRVTTETAPNSIEAVQQSIPNIVEVASVIDRTMTTLSNFGFEQQIPVPFSEPIAIGFDLGIDYNPEEPFDETVAALGSSLDGLPEQLRTLGEDLETANANLQTLSGNLETLSGDIETINEDIAALVPVLDEYLRIVDEVSSVVAGLRTRLQVQIPTIKTVVAVVLLAIALTQLAPVVLGFDLLTGWLDVDKEEMRKYVDERLAALESAPAASTAVAAKAPTAAASADTVVDQPDEKESDTGS